MKTRKIDYKILPIKATMIQNYCTLVLFNILKKTKKGAYINNLKQSFPHLTNSLYPNDDSPLAFVQEDKWQ